MLWWPTYSLGANIHRPVLSNGAEQVDADLDVDHPCTVCLRRCVSQGREGASGQCAGGAGRRRCDVGAGRCRCDDGAGGGGR